MEQHSVSWELELDELGGVPELPGAADGVLRIGSSDSVAFRLAAGSLPLLAGRAALLVVNELGQELEVEGVRDSPIVDWQATWYPAAPGPYEFAIRHFPESGAVPRDGPKTRIVVDPCLTIQGEPLPARGVVQLTVLSRLAGPIERWPESLAGHGRLGYNMVHFTPIQPPGESGSCYSLDDQNAVDPSLMEPGDLSPAARLKKVKVAVDKLHDEHGMLSAMDIVLNHTAGTSPWLLEHPECAYSVGNSPHLAAAAELDEKLAWFSQELKNGRYGGPNISDQGDVDRVMDGIRRHVVEPLHLGEYYEVDEAACLKAYAQAGGGFEGLDYGALKESALPSIGARRRGVTVSPIVARRCCRHEGELREQLRRLQVDLRGEYASLERDIFESLRGVITWERLECHNGPVGDGHLALVPCYFRRLTLTNSARKRLGKDTEVVAHNGWVMDWPATEDFAAPSWRSVYLRRHLCAWGDCVKLRFGQRPADAPYLWDHMTRYAVSMAEIFHAIRLDNAHSTPLHVSQHILAQIRKVKPHIWIFAELFTGNFQTDLLYQGTLGINALIREAMQCNSPAELANNLRGSLWGAHPVGAVSHLPTLSRHCASAPPPAPTAGLMMRSASFALLSSQSLPLRPRHCPALLFDCTHDNQTPRDKRDPRDALPNAALVAASCASAGSVRGYDELYGTNPSVVFERRLYKDLQGVGEFQLNWPTQPPAPSPECSPKVGPLDVPLSWRRGGAQKVVVRGAWDGWQNDLPLQREGDGTWSGSLTVDSSALPLQYKFVVDGAWLCDEAQPTSDDGKGNINNLLLPPGASNGKLQAVDGPAITSNGLPGIFAIKQVLNALHVRLACEGFVEVGVQQLAEEILAVQRRSPDSGRRTWFVTRSAFARDTGDALPWGTATLTAPGSIVALHVAATLFVPRDQPPLRESAGRLEGQACHLHVFKSFSEVADVWREGINSMVRLKHFPPGSVLVFSTSPNGEIGTEDELQALMEPEVIQGTLKGLSLSDLNCLLFSCESEERDRSSGARGLYEINGAGPLVYSGLLGVCTALDIARDSTNDLSQCPIMQNVKEGDWLLSYLTDRLSDLPALEPVRQWLSKVRNVIGKLPRELVPFNFDYVVAELCSAACDAVLSSSGNFVAARSGASPLLRDLALAALQFWAAVPSAPLHWDRAKQEGWQKVPSLCAGLPHFASGFMRNWGRDTFISLRGCLLLTNRFAEARDTLLVYASVVRHGLCPNLLDAANNPRYNARDATWFFLQGVQDYVEMAPEGERFLTTPVALKWPVAEWDAGLKDLEPKNIADLVHLILQAHARGIKFREWNAGSKIDEHMQDGGFNIEVRLDEETGVIYGGNEWNCGTWMDKMGSSAKAGNKGVPATPRDGAAVEIIGLLKSTLRWVSGLRQDVFPYSKVTTASGAELSYKEWDARLQRSFEPLFWIGPEASAPTKLRGYYRDTVGASRDWQDYQLRPNFPIAMALAPELFTPAHAQQALVLAAERLVGPLGICTLDPEDSEYRGDYINDDDSTDKSVAHGWNYHQGPEWVWPLGFFLRAWHHFCWKAANGDASMTRREILPWLLKHRALLRSSPWRSLPELTNSRGSVCHHSCPAQAWSIATLLDALHSLQ